MGIDVLEEFERVKTFSSKFSTNRLQNGYVHLLSGVPN